MAQATALGAAMARHFPWGLKAISGEVERWHALASGIPDHLLREDAIAAIIRKRANIHGAALFWTLPERPNPDLLRLLVAYEILADYLDCVSERTAQLGCRNGLQLHMALIDALDARQPVSEYYRHSPLSADGGYVRSLVASCRGACESLPSYELVRPTLMHAAHLTRVVLTLNHEPDAERRDELLRAWAQRHASCTSEFTWFEMTAGASAWLTILALLALAAEPRCTAQKVSAILDAYLPWISLSGTMLDSYVDTLEDAVNGAHSYIGHYQSIGVGTRRLAELLRISIAKASGLPNGQRHVVLVSCMAAMYLSKDSARAPAMRDATRRVAGSGGPLTVVLMPVLRMWRIAYAQQAS